MKITVEIEVDHTKVQPTEVPRKLAFTMRVIAKRVAAQPMMLIGDSADLMEHGVHVGTVKVTA
jgi:hypothetical protein